MTATTVNGLTVLADEPAPTGINDKAGNTVYYKQVRSLLLENGTITYGCAHCDYTADNPNSVRPHLNKHRQENAERRAATARKLDPKTNTLADVLAAVARVNEITADRDRWKDRALKAEDDLATIQKAIRSATRR